MFQNILAALIGVLAILGCVEGGARVLANVLGISSYMKYDERVGWVAEPSTTKHHKSSHLGFDVHYQINEKGLRGPSYSEERPQGVYRVVVLGDSNGFGWGIAEGRYFSAIIGDRLRQVEIINLSLSGYGTDQEYLRFLEAGAAYKPDLVIVQVTPNDFEEIQYPFFNQKAKPQFVLADDGSLQLVNVPVRPVGEKSQEFYEYSIPVPFKEWLGWHSYAYNYFNEKYYLLRRAAGSNKAGESKPVVFSPKSVALFKRIVRELKGALDQAGARGLIVHASKEISENNYLTDSSLPVLDLHSKFSDHMRTAGVELYYKDGVHWNNEGHRIIAEELMSVIERYRGAKEGGE